MRKHSLLSCPAAMTLAATVLLPFAAHATLGKITKLHEFSRKYSSATEEASGITWAGGDLYYVVEDSLTNLCPVTISINRSTGEISSATFGQCVKVVGANDMEGCAFDPASGNVWISQEPGAYIREYNPVTGTLTRSAPVPSIMKQYDGNYSLEALTISGDGLTMWTANEEALKCDGAHSSTTAGTVVRLVKFNRESVRDNWTPAGQWAYEVTVHQNTQSGSYSRSGVSALVALPDGTLLVLERMLDGLSTFYNRIYQVNFAGATEISGITSLKDTPYFPVGKAELFNQDVGWVNYEGMCLGPRLEDGSATLVLISDGGSYASDKIMVLKLPGIDVRTLDVAGADESEPVGGPYRYVNGQTVTATLPGGGSPYETALRAHPAWEAPANGASGEGSAAAFAIAADDTLRWSVTTNLNLPLLGADSFERLAAGTDAADISGWSGEAWVEATTYDPATPPGWPLVLETHSGVLAVDGDAVRSYASVPGEGAMVDAMVRVTRASADAPAEEADGQIALYFAADGRATLQHRSPGGSMRLRTPLSPRVFANGEWVRASLLFDYGTGPSGTAWCQVRLDGEPCVTDAGVRSPANPVSPGSWYRTLDGGAAGQVNEVAFLGTGAVDDLALYDAAGAFEFDGPTKTNGVPYAWFNEQGLAWDPAGDIDADLRDARAEYAAGTDPWDETDYLRILATGFDEAGRFTVLFNGTADLERFAVEEIEDLAEVAKFGDAAWTSADGYGPILRRNGTNVWTQATQLQNAAPQRFFRVKVELKSE